MQRLLVIMDLDETLVHSMERPFLDCTADFRPGDGIHTIRRPGLDAFLQRIFAITDVAVWSSATRDYADSMVRHIFQNPERLRFDWARDRCTERWDEGTGEVYWSKPLTKVRRRGIDLARVVIVDDDARVATQNYGNLVLARPWTGVPEDRDLERVLEVLTRLRDEPDVRRARK